ncbi:hypothetical protein SLS64_006690 [Diaporthe eres]|uniref:2EXR domain-containing protein n=1 Tax=Diaporthe eres TaxID=83184 RepID=A0ABR1P2R8_DIAER
MPLDKFHLFHALPPEIQDSIWELCLPRRVISPYYSPVSQEILGTLPGTRYKTYLPVRALIPFRPPLISRVCRRARATVLRCGQYTPVRVEERDDSKSDGWVWLEKKSDWIYFNYHTLMEGLDESGAGPKVFELARDVGVPLLIDSTIQGDHENPLHASEDYYDPSYNELDHETVGSRLYDSFLRGREHFYYVMAEVVLVVTGMGRKHIVDTGLFGLLGEDMAIVPTADKGMLQQYKSLYNMYDAREAPHNDCPARIQLTIDSLIKGEDQATVEPRTLIRGLLERICQERGEFGTSANDMMNEDGSLKPEHPVVKKLGIAMPICEKVVIFELRRLDTLVEDSVQRPHWYSTDSTDSTDTSGTSDTDTGDL